MARDSHKQWRQCTGTMFLAWKRRFSREIPLPDRNGKFKLKSKFKICVQINNHAFVINIYIVR